MNRAEKILEKECKIKLSHFNEVCYPPEVLKAMKEIA